MGQALLQRELRFPACDRDQSPVSIFSPVGNIVKQHGTPDFCVELIDESLGNESHKEYFRSSPSLNSDVSLPFPSVFHLTLQGCTKPKLHGASASGCVCSLVFPEGLVCFLRAGSGPKMHIFRSSPGLNQDSPSAGAGK